MRSSFYGALLATVMLAGPGPATAEDIDLFVQPPGAAAGAPNVLILLDNTANWSRTVSGQAIYINEIAALVSTVNDLSVNADGTAKFRVGLMLFTETGGGNNTIDGGYVRAAVRGMTAANKTKYMALLNSLHVLNDRSNGGKAGKTYSEAYQYFSGLAPFSGNNKVKTDYTANVVTTSAPLTAAGVAASNAIYALPGNAINSKPGTPYNSPIIPGSCARNYIIYISNGAAQDNASDNSTATTQLATAATAEGITGATTALPLSPSGSATNVADEWSRFMHRSSKNIVSYTVDVDKITTGQGPGWSALLKSIATVSSGKYFSVTSGNGGASIADALGEIFSKIQAVNSVFASVSLPVSVNTEGTYLNQVYIGMFRPDADAMPLWAGNLKQFKLARFGNTLRTVDAYDYPDTIDALTGFVDRCARSFWTPTTMDSYWSFRPQGDCNVIPAIGATPPEPLTNSAYSNRPDGNIVEKGAQAYKLRSTTTRTVKTCSATFASCTTLTDFNSTNVTDAMLGTTAGGNVALVNWAKGQDVKDEDIDAVTTAEMRPSAHGDVVHSRPTAINFGTDPLYPIDCNATGPKVVVFYGGNDGVLRAINGNRCITVNGVAPGAEYWSFIPPEFYASLKPLYDNNVQIDFEGNPTTPVQPKPYGIDGPIAAFKDATRTWIYPAMRRGGRALYAFDVSGLAADTPVAPTLKWKKGCPNQADDTGCSTGFTDLGQTWSAPKVLKAGGYGSGASPMLIMGGGYDTCQDADPHTCTSASKGDHIYVLDADTGALLKTFDTDRQVIGDVVISADASTGRANWGYAVDMGGNVYRLSGVNANTPFGNTAPGSWTITKIASLGCATTATCAANRKFMFAPGVVNENGTYVLLIGSGDREKPLRNWSSAYGTSNYFFVLRDVPNDDEWLSDEAVNCGSAVMCLSSLLLIPAGSADPAAADLAAKKGWYLGTVDHEQVVTSAITVFNTTTFSTHTPVPAGATGCTSNLGTARVYNVSYKNASSQNGTNNRNEVISGGGLPPSPVAGMVTLDDGSTVPFLIGGDPDSALQSLLPTGPATGSQPKAVTYWYIHK